MTFSGANGGSAAPCELPRDIDFQDCVVVCIDMKQPLREYSTQRDQPLTALNRTLKKPKNSKLAEVLHNLDDQKTMRSAALRR